jgi:hypothetical protein
MVEKIALIVRFFPLTVTVWDVDAAATCIREINIRKEVILIIRSIWPGNRSAAGRVFKCAFSVCRQ